MNRPERVVTAEGLERRYLVGGGLFKAAGEVQALRGVSFSLDQGRTLAVVGESGCGKSTLARLVTLIEKPTAGRLELDGVDPVGANAETKRRLRRTVQIVFQNPYGSLNPRQKITDILQEPVIINTDTPPAARVEAVSQMLRKVGLRPEQAQRYPHMFSGGQRQRIAIARAVMLRPKVVVLDEPVDPGPGAQPPGRAAGRVPPRLPVRLPQPLGRPPFRRRRHGHVPRPRGRAGLARRHL